MRGHRALCIPTSGSQARRLTVLVRATAAAQRIVRARLSQCRGPLERRFIPPAKAQALAGLNPVGQAAAAPAASDPGDAHQGPPSVQARAGACEHAPGGDMHATTRNKPRAFAAMTACEGTGQDAAPPMKSDPDPVWGPPGHTRPLRSRAAGKGVAPVGAKPAGNCPWKRCADRPDRKAESAKTCVSAEAKPEDPTRA